MKHGMDLFFEHNGYEIYRDMSSGEFDVYDADFRYMAHFTFFTLAKEYVLGL